MREPGAPAGVPGWVGIGLLPLLNLGLAFALSGLVVLAVGESPSAALRVLVYGAVGHPEAIGYTLYYATDFIFAGLAVALAFHAGLFNLGGEGQATIGGLGVGLTALALGGWPWPVAGLAGLVAGAAFGAAWAFLPGWLQARRGSHIVITTIMFNFIAASLMTWLMVDVLIKPGQPSPESRTFDPSVWLPAAHDVLGGLGGLVGLEAPRTPLNLSFLVALAACLLVWVFVWRTRWGYEVRAVGLNERAARYAGIAPERTIVLAMALSGALAGCVGLNAVLGAHHRLLLDATHGVGYVGIAVALMGRNHPAGIVAAALLFGALHQGGSELSFEFQSLNREMVVVIQGLVILCTGALENLFRPRIEALFLRGAAKVVEEPVP